MRKILAILILAAFAVPSFAGLTATLKNNTNNEGGSYLAKVYDGSDKVMEFNTFCLEYGEEFRNNTLYDVTIDETIKDSGLAPATLDDTTKMLYAAYINGNLSDNPYLHYSEGTTLYNDRRYSQLQAAFWAIESADLPSASYLNWTTGSNGLSTFTNDLVTVVRNLTTNELISATISSSLNLPADLDYENVMVMNLWQNGNAIQSQLIYFSSGNGNDTPAVPAPSAVLLSGIGTCLVGMVRRRSL